MQIQMNSGMNTNYHYDWEEKVHLGWHPVSLLLQLVADAGSVGKGNYKTRLILLFHVFFQQPYISNIFLWFIMVQKTKLVRNHNTNSLLPQINSKTKYS